MAYNWGAAAFPSSPFDGQLYVDDSMRVWQYSSAGGAWNKRPDFEFRVVSQRALFTQGINCSQPGDTWIFRSNEWMENNWDYVFPLAFVEVSNPSTGAVLGRRAMMGRADLKTWVVSLLPKSGVPPNQILTAHSYLKVFQIFDPSVRLDRVQCWNSLYGALRGRKKYRKGVKCGVDPKVYTWGSSPMILAKHLVTVFTGQVPATNQDLAIWYSNDGRNLFNQPQSVGQPYDMPAMDNRMCWNSTTHAWVPAPAGRWVTANGTAANNPIMLGTSFTPSQLETSLPTDMFKGLKLLTYGLSVCLVYNLVLQGSEHLHAFRIKPTGIDRIAVHTTLDPARWLLMAESRYLGDAHTRQYMRVTVQDKRPTDGWRWNVFPSFPMPTSSFGLRSANGSDLPRAIRFYVVDNVTGLRSPLFPWSVQVVRRKNNLPFSFQEAR